MFLEPTCLMVREEYHHIIEKRRATMIQRARLPAGLNASFNVEPHRHSTAETPRVAVQKPAIRIYAQANIKQSLARQVWDWLTE